MSLLARWFGCAPFGATVRPLMQQHAASPHATTTVHVRSSHADRLPGDREAAHMPFPPVQREAAANRSALGDDDDDDIDDADDGDHVSGLRSVAQDLDDLEELLMLAVQEQSMLTAVEEESARRKSSTRTLDAKELELLPEPDPTGEVVECPICLEDMIESFGDLRMLPACGHRFHGACLRAWLGEKKAVCPLDNMEITFAGDALPGSTTL